MSRVTFTTDDDGGVTILVYPFLLPNAAALRSACEYISIDSPLSLFLSLLNFISPGAFRKGKWTLKVSSSLRCVNVGHFEERQTRGGRGERPLETYNRTTRWRWRKREKSRVINVQTQSSSGRYQTFYYVVEYIIFLFTYRAITREERKVVYLRLNPRCFMNNDGWFICACWSSSYVENEKSSMHLVFLVWIFYA